MKSYKVKAGKHTADCRELESFPYQNGRIVFGLARGLPHGDDIYFGIIKGRVRSFHFFRDDEAIAIVSGLARAAWFEKGLENVPKEKL